LVRSVYAQLRPHGRDHQGPAHGGPNALRTGLCWLLRSEFRKKYAPYDLEFSFDSGRFDSRRPERGKIVSHQHSTPGQDVAQSAANDKNADDVLFHVAKNIIQAVQGIDGIADARVLEKNDAPEFMITVTASKRPMRA